MVMCARPCCSLSSSDPLRLAVCSQVCSVNLRVYSCPADRLISIIFLDTINLCIDIVICFSLPDLFHSVASFHVFISYLTNDFFGEVSAEVFCPLFFDWVVYFSDIELHELLVYFGDKCSVRCFICYDFLPFKGLSFHLIYSFLCCAKSF